MRAPGGILIAVFLALLAASQPAAAQEDVQANTYITPFPENDLYRMQVVGDSLAEGLVGGLIDAFGGDTRIQLQRKHRALAGLVRPEAEDEIKAFAELLAREPTHVAVVMLGLYDRIPIRLQGPRRFVVGSKEWKVEYGAKVDRVMKLLKGRNAAVYWVGVPVLRRVEWNAGVQMINEIVRERAYLNGVKYIDAYEGFVDEVGNFNLYGPDLTGKMRLLREPDGVHFTHAGNRKLAHFVEREIRRDLTQAKNARNIPLAGSEIEQRRISPPKPQAVALEKGASGAAGTAKGAADAPTGLQQGSPHAAAPGDPTDQKADNAKITLRTIDRAGREEAVTVDILRPAIPASVIAVVTRKDSTDRASHFGDTVSEELSGGLQLLSSISPATDGGAGGQRRRMAPTQTPYFKVLVKGERMPPKPGRADDFRWPRQGAADNAAQPPLAPRSRPMRSAPKPTEVPAAQPKS
jgi:uncharacterized protein